MHLISVLGILSGPRIEYGRDFEVAAVLITFTKEILANLAKLLLALIGR